MMTGNGGYGRVRGVGGAVLLIILAACAYMGAREEPIQTVSVAVTRQSYPLDEASEDSAASVAQRLRNERENELALLQNVVSAADTDVKTRESALSQMADIAQRMEIEAQTLACLEGMGCAEAAAVYGAQMLTVIIPYEYASNDTDKLRMLEAVAGLTGLEPGDIKIILTKK